MLPGRGSPQHRPTLRSSGSAVCSQAQACSSSGWRRPRSSSTPNRSQSSSWAGVPGAVPVRDQPLQTGGLPVDGVEPGHRIDAVGDESPSLLRGGVGEEALLGVEGVLDGHLTLDEAHDEEGASRHRRVGLVADDGRDRHRGVRRDRAHHPVLDLDLPDLLGGLRGVDRRLRVLEAEHELLVGHHAVPLARGGEHHRLGRVPLTRGPAGIDHGHSVGVEARGQPLLHGSLIERLGHRIPSSPPRRRASRNGERRRYQRPLSGK